MSNAEPETTWEEGGVLACPHCKEDLGYLGDMNDGLNDCEDCGGEFIIDRHTTMSAQPVTSPEVAKGMTNQ